MLLLAVLLHGDHMAGKAVKQAVAEALPALVKMRARADGHTPLGERVIDAQ